jgi:hypothetical protein
MENNILPSNVKDYIIVKPKKYNSKNDNWITIGLKIIKNNNEKEKYKLVFIDEKNKNININILKINKDSKLDNNSIYIGILDYTHQNGSPIKKIVYYGKKKGYIKNKTNEIVGLQFENKKIFFYNQGQLYKLISNIYKKYGISENNWTNERILENEKKKGINFLFKKLDEIHIPNGLLYHKDNIIAKYSHNNYNSYNSNNQFENNAINHYIKRIGKNDIIVSNNLNNLNEENIKNEIFIKLTKTNTNNLNNYRFYFAYIKYIFIGDGLFNKLIYLGKFIKNEDDFLFFENIIINPKLKNLKEFNLYYVNNL